MQNSSLPLDPELWVRLPVVRPFAGRRRLGALATALVALVVLVGAALITGIASPRLVMNGGGGGTRPIDGDLTNPDRRSYEFVLLANSSLRPWTISDARADGDDTVAWDLQLSHDVTILQGLPSEPQDPVSVGIGEKFAVVVTLPEREVPCVDGLAERPPYRIEVAVDGLFGRRWMTVGSTGTSTTGCSAG